MSEVSEILAALDELVLLTPALPAALLRDRAGVSNSSPSRGGSVRPRQVNSDVADALDLLRREVGTPLKEKLGSLRSWVIQDGEEPGELLEEVSRWLRSVRKALRLSEAPKSLGEQCCCPNHPSEPVRLLVGGREGHLQPVPDDGEESISWSYMEVIFCPACGSEWERSQWNTLHRALEAQEHWAAVGRELTEAVDAQRLTDGVALSQAYGIPAGTIRQWANRGILKRFPKDSRGRVRYSILEFEEVLAHMRGSTCEDPYAV